MLEKTQYEPDSNGLLKSFTDANGNTTRYAYDGHGWPTSQTGPDGSIVKYGYDNLSGDLLTMIDQVQNTTAFAYDKLGRRKQITYADQSQQFYEYNPMGHLSQETDPAGALKRYEYDSLGRLVTTHQYPTTGSTAVDYTTTYAYDAVGNLVALTDAIGNSSTFTYDGVGRKLSVSDPLGHKTTYNFDAAGNTLSVTDANNNTVSSEYDSLDRRTKTTIPSGRVTTFTYDVLGRKTSQKDPLGNATTYFYDPVGRLVTVVDALGFVTRTEYDRVGNKVAVTDAQRRTTQYVYDVANRQIKEIRTDGVSVQNQYDPAGRTVAMINGRGQTIGYRYDPRNRLVEVNYSNARHVNFTYDAAGRRTSMSDWNGTTTYQYNQLGWLIQQVDPWNHTVAYSYDKAGNRSNVSLQYAGVNLEWTYAYDKANNLTSLQSPGVGGSNTFVYDAGNRLTKMTYPNGNVVSYGYNGANEITSILGTTSQYSSTNPLLNFSYTFDSAGRRTTITRSGPGVVDASTTYQYDADNRLASVGTPSGSSNDQEYYYDVVGNRHTAVSNTGDPKGVYTYVNDAAYRLLDEFGPRSSQLGGGRYHLSYWYDADGNQTRAVKDDKETTLYTYDEDSLLLQVTDPSGNVTQYSYDGDGKRVRMDERGGTTFFIYDGSEVLAETDPTGAIQVVYTRTLSGRLISQWQKGDTYWYHLDALGSTIAVTDERGAIKNKYGYDAYGNLAAATTEQVLNRYTFTGQVWDSSAGLYYYKARYYNPTVGRFLTQDTWHGSPWEPWTQNLYVYVGNNPVNYVDPTGHMPDFLKNWAAQVYSRTNLSSGALSGAVFATNMLAGNIGEVYNSFHDIAQINIVRALGGNALLEVGLRGTKADVVGPGAQVWEVKPLGGESPERQLAQAEANGLVRGQPLEPITGITVAPNLYMKIDFPAAGEAKYSFYKYKEGKEVRVSSVGAALTVSAWAAAGGLVGAAAGLATVAAPEITIPALGTLFAL